MTQNERIKRHLETLGEISSRDAFVEYGCMRLAARVWDLKHKYGLRITKETKTARNRFNEAVSYAVYRLDEQRKDET